MKKLLSILILNLFISQFGFGVSGVDRHARIFFDNQRGCPENLHIPREQRMGYNIHKALSRYMQQNFDDSEEIVILALGSNDGKIEREWMEHDKKMHIVSTDFFHAKAQLSDKEISSQADLEKEVWHLDAGDRKQCYRILKVIQKVYHLPSISHIVLFSAYADSVHESYWLGKALQNFYALGIETILLSNCMYPISAPEKHPESLIDDTNKEAELSLARTEFLSFFNLPQGFYTHKEHGMAVRMSPNDLIKFMA